MPLLGFLLLAPIFCQGQEIVGLNFSNRKLKLAKANPTTGQLQILSPNVLSLDPFLNGDAAYDPIGDRYFYVQGNMATPNLLCVDAETGVPLSVSIVQNVNGGNAVLFNMVYHPNEDALYGLNMLNQGLYLTKVQPTTGQATIISNQSIGPAFFQSGDAAIDVAGGRYIFTQGTGNSQKVVSVSLTTGQVISSPVITNPNNAIAALVNIAYNPLDQQLYGLNFSGYHLRFVSVDPQTGITTMTNPNPLSGDLFSSGDGILDPATGRYFYVRGRPSQLYTVDITTGTLIGSPTIMNPNNAVAPIMNIVLRDSDCNSPLIGNPDPLGPDTVVFNPSYTLYPNIPNAAYQWWNGDTTDSQTVTQSGTYWVDILIDTCIYRDSVFVDFQLVSKTSSGVVISSFPNPSLGPVTVSLNIGEIRDGLLMVADMKGRIWWDYALDGYVANTPIRVDLSQLPRGTYLFRYQDGLEIVNEKIVKF